MTSREHGHITRCDSTEVSRSASRSRIPYREPATPVIATIRRLGAERVARGSASMLLTTPSMRSFPEKVPPRSARVARLVPGSRAGARQHPPSRQAHVARGAAAGGGEQAVLASGHLNPLAHAGEAEVAAAGEPVDAAGVEADAVVADLHVGAVVVAAQVHPDVVRPGVLGDVDERLLRDPVQHRL